MGGLQHSVWLSTSGCLSDMADMCHGQRGIITTLVGLDASLVVVVAACLLDIKLELRSQNHQALSTNCEQNPTQIFSCYRNPAFQLMVFQAYPSKTPTTSH
jgi:hypothetical protein